VKDRGAEVVGAELAMGLIAFAAATGAVFALVAIGALPPSKDNPILAMLYGPAVTLLAASIYGYAANRGDSATSSQSMPLKATTAWVAAGTAAALVGSHLLGVLLEALGYPVVEQSAVLEILRAPSLQREMLALLVAAVGIAPLAEEYFFRHLLFRRIAASGGPRLAYFISAIGFAAVHGNPSGAVIYVWLGLVFAAVYHRTQRLSAAVAVHALNNATAIAVLMLWPR